MLRRSWAAALACTFGVASCGMSPAASHPTTSALPALPPPTSIDGRSDQGASDPSLGQRVWINDCVRYIQYGAYNGNLALRALFDAAAQDEDELRHICETYGQPDLTGLSGLHAAPPAATYVDG